MPQADPEDVVGGEAARLRTKEAELACGDDRGKGEVNNCGK